MSATPFKSGFCFALIAGALLVSAAGALAQRAFTISISLTNQSQVVVRWNAQFATPIGDLFITPHYQVQRSGDLQTWTSIGVPFTGALLTNTVLIDSISGAAFYRVESIISLEYAHLENKILDLGQLDGGDFFGASLFNASLKSAQLRGANFSGADLSNADLFEADLSGANLFGVEAANATFNSASLQRVDARFGDFQGASMVRTDLTGADLSSAILTGASLDLARFQGAIMDTNTVIDPKPKLIWQIVNQGAPNAVFTNQDLDRSFLEGANLNGAKLIDAHLLASDLERADLRGADLTGADLRLVDFLGTVLDTNTILSSQALLVWQIRNQNAGANANLAGAGLNNVWLLSANLVNADLTGANCTNSEFFQANLGGANCTRASFLEADMPGTILTNANLTSANMTFVNLTGANLRDAITNGCDFGNAIFSKTIMPDGTVRNF